MVRRVEWGSLICGSQNGKLLRLTPSEAGSESFGPKLACRPGETMWGNIHSHISPRGSLGFSADPTHAVANDVDSMALYPTISFYVADALGNFHKSLNGNATPFGQTQFPFRW